MTLPPPVLIFSSMPTQEIDVELFTFVERYATNLARWDLLVYFGKHPSTNDNVSRIAQHVGRAPRLVKKELDDLTFLGILRANRNNGSVHYGLSRSPSTRRAVVRLARDYSTKR